MTITLKAARTNVGLSREKAAVMLGISAESLKNYENGKTFPTVDTVKKMEDLYGVAYADLNFIPKVTV